MVPVSDHLIYLAVRRRHSVVHWRTNNRDILSLIIDMARIEEVVRSSRSHLNFTEEITPQINDVVESNENIIKTWAVNLVLDI